MRGRCLLNPLPHLLLTPKPPSRPLAVAARFRARAAPRPPAPLPRRAPLDEPDVGISRFASSVPGFRGALKQRYSDFVVHEVALDGALVRLTSFDLPHVDEGGGDDAEDSDADADHSRALESFRLLCGEADYDALRGLLERALEGGDEDLSPIILSADADKAHRSEVHEFIKRNFKFLVTDTVEHSDGIQKCIRVRLGSGPHGGRGRNRRGMGSSGWRDDRPFDSRGSTSWPYHLGKYLRFHLYKENRDTQEALGVIGKMLGVQVTLFKVHASRLGALNSNLTGLALGQLRGNRFAITLRNVVAESDDVIKSAIDGLSKNGFINYYGLQVQGIGSVPTHFVGAALLRGEWRQAVSLILGTRVHYKGHGDIDAAISGIPRHLTVERAMLLRLKKFPGNYLQALMAIPRTMRLMYVNSYQSYLWNHAASMRVKKYGTFTCALDSSVLVQSALKINFDILVLALVLVYMLTMAELTGISQIVEGDLVYKKGCSPGEAAKEHTLDDDVSHTDSPEVEVSFDTLPEELIQPVKIVDSEDLLKAAYTFEDVVLPLPGSETLLPGNEVAGIYHEIAKKHGYATGWYQPGKECPWDQVSHYHKVHFLLSRPYVVPCMKGGYRRVLQRPIDFEWDLMTYTDDNVPLVKTDLAIVSKTQPSEANKLLSDATSSCPSCDSGLDASLEASGLTTEASPLKTKSDLLPEKLAVKLEFTRPASSYATMAIRELTKTSTSVCS
ncbi:hypothetical protein HU200_045961 [Digitaria exilis]|uniref:TRUD domain-containing protein n=1 Tax=Digitaria exilis TaxID=1010633 RepID=A0A835B1X9_9POAL|nr:hypothetical protein HU200_045961 [Digitaria exilis]